MSHVLAVLGKVIKIDDIPNADRIKSATVVCGEHGKWVGVVGLDIGERDLVTVFLQDAILPKDERWAFMEKHKGRVKICKLRGSPSECLILQLGDYGEIGTDLTAKYNVTKFEKALPPGMNGVAEGVFPSFIPKTDEENFQKRFDLVERMSKEPWVATLKMDGSSGTAWVDETGKLHVCSRNLELKEFDGAKTNSYWSVARKFKLETLPVGIALQFEVCGPSIQKNPAGFTEVTGFAFKAYHINEKRYLNRTEFELLVPNGMPFAKRLFDSDQIGVSVGGQELKSGPLFSAENLREMSEWEYPNGRPAEGIVITALDSSWSFKVINPLYES